MGCSAFVMPHLLLAFWLFSGLRYLGCYATLNHHTKRSGDVLSQSGYDYNIDSTSDASCSSSP